MTAVLAGSTSVRIEPSDEWMEVRSDPTNGPECGDPIDPYSVLVTDASFTMPGQPSSSWATAQFEQHGMGPVVWRIENTAAPMSEDLAAAILEYHAAHSVRAADAVQRVDYRIGVWGEEPRGHFGFTVWMEADGAPVETYTILGDADILGLP
ncbi:MAG: hypothetical protein R3F61_25535 [Myxococcota bacterium]